MQFHPPVLMDGHNVITSTSQMLCWETSCNFILDGQNVITSTSQMLCWRPHAISSSSADGWAKCNHINQPNVVLGDLMQFPCSQNTRHNALPITLNLL